jgi:hypothetical protein
MSRVADAAVSASPEEEKKRRGKKKIPNQSMSRVADAAVSALPEEEKERKDKKGEKKMPHQCRSASVFVLCVSEARFFFLRCAWRMPSERLTGCLDTHLRACVWGLKLLVYEALSY